jgi:hypothetical protein
MGTQVATQYNDPKSAMVLGTVAPGALVPGAGELVIWSGDTHINQTEIHNAMSSCMDHLRERGVPVAAAVTGALIHVGLGEGQITFFEGAATPALTENDVCVFYAQDFDSGYGASTELWDVMHKRAQEKLFEEFYKLR